MVCCARLIKVQLLGKVTIHRVVSSLITRLGLHLLDPPGHSPLVKLDSDDKESYRECRENKYTKRDRKVICLVYTVPGQVCEVGQRRCQCQSFSPGWQLAYRDEDAAYEDEREFYEGGEHHYAGR